MKLHSSVSAARYETNSPSRPHQKSGTVLSYSDTKWSVEAIRQKHITPNQVVDARNISHWLRFFFVNLVTLSQLTVT